MSEHQTNNRKKEIFVRSSDATSRYLSINLTLKGVLSGHILLPYLIGVDVCFVPIVCITTHSFALCFPCLTH